MDITSIAGIISAGKEIVVLLREVKSLIPDSEKTKDIVKRIEDAERKLNEHQALTAKELGYLLCQCTYPPQIMLYQHQQSLHVCQACGFSAQNVPVSGGHILSTPR